MNNLIGVIGGLGPKATTYFMDLVIDNTISSRDQDNVDLLVCQYSSIPDRTSYIVGNSSDSPVPKMLECAKLLENSGVKYIVIPCNTASYFFDEIQSNVSCSVVNILEVTSKKALEGNPSRVGLMATDGTILSHAYHKFINNDVLFIPNEFVQKKIMSLIYGKVKKNILVSLDEFMDIVNYFKDNGCDKIILGCTELSVVYKSLNLVDDMIVDSLTVLARETVRLSGKELM